MIRLRRLKVPPNIPGDPFQQASFGEACDVGVNDNFDGILIPPVMPENTLHLATRSYNVVSQSPETRIFQDHSDPVSARENSSTEFLNMIFNSSFEHSLAPGNSLHPSHLTGIVPPENPVAHAVTNHGLISHVSADENVAKVQQLWPGCTPRTARSHFWHEIAFGSSGNIFTDYAASPEVGALKHSHDGNTSLEINLTDYSKRRLRSLKRKILSCECNTILDDGATCGGRYLCINTTEVFDQGLYLYAHKYQPAYPVLHLATFNSDATSELLLFVMCMIGICLLKTEDAVSFIRGSYPVRKTSLS